ncbi:MULTISPECIES: LPS assembly lipoprotein LptE [unclassified Acidovorax]|uniref:LPS-assembly lipoprotein LptE n=1 Tax=unclassified Acidovorax TaxID=2684926 RepID=UPI002883233D|nr:MULTISPECIES: LPS assembly lipoprotein LptE [unclassified Acidovorax]
MQRRTLLAGLAATTLTACGFRLRGAPDFSFRSLYVQAQPGSAIGRELRRTLQGSGGNLTLLTEPTQLTQAEAILDILSEQQERSVVGVNASGQVRELQLRLRMRFRLRNQQGVELIPDTELMQQRDVSYNESVALSKEGEEALLFRNMQTDLVQQLMRRLAAVKTI